MPAFFANAAPRAGSSRKSMPTNSTGAWSAWSSAPRLLQVGRLGDARRAPRAPDVEDEHLAAGRGAVPRRAVEQGARTARPARRGRPRGSSRRHRRRRRSPSGRRPWPAPRRSSGPACTPARAEEERSGGRHRRPTGAVGRTVMRPPRAGPGRAATRPARCSDSESSSSSRKVKRGERGERALAVAPGCGPERPALGGEPDHPDRRLVADDDGLVARGPPSRASTMARRIRSTIST